MMEKKQGLFDALPIEVVALIVEFFDAVTLCQFAAVCSKAKVPSLSASPTQID